MFCGSGWSGGWIFSGWIVPGLFMLALLGGAAWLLRRRTPSSGHASKACPRCGGSVREVYFRCPHCGDALKRNCPGCSRVVDQVWEFCPFCSVALNAGGKTSNNHRDNGTTNPMIRKGEQHEEQS